MAVMLTTVDNPFDPRLDFLAWYNWDTRHGYHTCEYLASIAYLTEEFPENIRDQETEQAIDEIIEMHNGEIYKKLEIEEP